MKNKMINFKNLCSSISLFSLFLISCGDELKAESLSASEKKYVASSEIKWVRYKELSEDKEIETLKKDFEDPNNQFITKVKKKPLQLTLVLKISKVLPKDKKL